MDQNFSQYHIFYVVAKAGNISKAAEELYITQPAISKSISKLEYNLETQLFLRSSRGVQLTESGQMLFDHVKIAFEELNEGISSIRKAKDLHIGHLRIGVSNTLCRYVLIPYLKKFIAEYPHIKISIESQPSSASITMLEQQHIDLGLIAEPSSLRSFQFLPIMEIEDIFAATPSYLENLRLREGKDADIFQCGNIMLLNRENNTRMHVEEYLASNQIHVNNFLEVTTMDLLLEFTKIGLGVGGIIREFAETELENGSLVEIKLPSPPPKRNIGIAFVPGGNTDALDTFLQFMEKENGFL